MPGEKMIIDAGNPLLGQAPSRLEAGILAPPGKTLPEDEGAPIDEGNPLLGVADTRLDTGTMWTPGAAQTAILTIYSASTTFTLFLAPEDVSKWAGGIAGIANAVSGYGEGYLGVLAFFTATTRLTVCLALPDLRKWASIMTGLAASMSKSGLVAASPGSVQEIPRANGSGHRPGLNGRSG
jgi:hypothetical protein